jgi:hypothetical protein
MKASRKKASPRGGEVFYGKSLVPTADKSMKPNLMTNPSLFTCSGLPFLSYSCVEVKNLPASAQMCNLIVQEVKVSRDTTIFPPQRQLVVRFLRSCLVYSKYPLNGDQKPCDLIGQKPGPGPINSRTVRSLPEPPATEWIMGGSWQDHERIMAGSWEVFRWCF